MATSIAAIPSNATPSTGPYNWIEVGKFIRLCVIWIGLIFVPVWLASWAVGELLPQLISMTWPGDQTAAVIIQLLQIIVPLVSVLVFIPINAMFMVLCERRALALFTVRKGPNRVGPDGLFQTAADAIKLLFKEDITPTGADAAMFTLAPIIFFAPSIFGALPLLAAATANHPLFAMTNVPTGIFYVLAMSSIPVVALVMGGWSSNNKYSLVGGLRSAAQAISYEIPLVLAIVTICYMAGTLDVVQIVNQQLGQAGYVQNLATLQSAPPSQIFSFDPASVPLSAGFWHWNLFGQNTLYMGIRALSVDPIVSLASFLLFLSCVATFGIYLTGACAEINRIPFDLPEAESELVSGYNTEYSGIKFAIFFLAEFTNLFIVSSIATVMFLGGGSSPFPGFLDPHFFQQFVFAPLGQILPAGSMQQWLIGSLINPVTLSTVLWVIIKVYSLVIFAILIRGTLPRFRIDQLMDFGWKRLIPLSLFLLLSVTFLCTFLLEKIKPLQEKLNG